MEFTLHYRGTLKANGGTRHKHDLRQHFHKQLAALWKQRPLVNFRPRLLSRVPDIGADRPASAAGTLPIAPDPSKSTLCILKQVGGFEFAPLVSTAVHLVVELDIVMMWPHKRGHIVTSGGDLDNRVKTLLDALRAPTSVAEIPKGAEPPDGDEAFFCLLEDDSLITRLNVSSRRLLEPNVPPAEVDLYVSVLTKQVEVMIGTIGLA